VRLASKELKYRVAISGDVVILGVVEHQLEPDPLRAIRKDAEILHEYRSVLSVDDLRDIADRIKSAAGDLEDASST